MSLTVYKSSAGSGKTYTLVLEYLSLVIANPDSYRNILAITFTNKAANEMKGRIVQALTDICYPKSRKEEEEASQLMNKIGQKTGLDFSTIKSRSEKALSNILHGYSNFAVSTIDSFVHGLVRSFARELKLPVNFDVELDENKLIDKAIDLLMSKVGTDEQITNLLVKFVTTNMNDEKSWNIENELRTFTKILLKESSLKAVASLHDMKIQDFLAISRHISETVGVLKTELMQPAKEALRLITENGIEPEYLYYGATGVYGYFNRFAKADFSNYLPNSRIKNLLEGQEWTSRKCPPAMKQVIEQLMPELTILLEKQVMLVDEKMKTLLLLELINQNIFSTALLSEIENVMEEFRNNENIVHISEFNKRIAGVLHHNPVPFIYERIGEKYHNLLIDEFQDTSVLQWQNLLPLMENSLAANHFNMIVGDGKQAIYRWRSGEVEQFAALPEIFARPDDNFWHQRQQLFNSQYREDNLAKNFRSAKEIVEFNNDFFDFASTLISGDLKKIYDGQKQTFRDEKTGGQVHIEFISKEGLSSDELLETELERILRIVTDQSAAFNLSEIAILTRTNADASLIARYLLSNEINVVTAEALWLSASSDINFLIDVLRYLNEPGISPVVAGMAAYLYENHSKNSGHLHDFFELVQEINPKNPEAKPIQRLMQEMLGFDFRDEELRALPIYEMADRIIKIFGLNAGGQNPFIPFFMDTILRFTNRNSENLTDFLSFWDQSGYKTSIIVPEKAEAVKVMTIHKAKGLQFPVVIYPFAKHQSKLAINDLWIEPDLENIPQLKSALVRNGKTLSETAFMAHYEKELQKSFLDSLNILYVAMTRPSERLFVLLHDKHNEKGEWNIASPFPDNADLLSSYLQKIGLWDKTRKVYSFGSFGEFRAEAISTKKVAQSAETSMNESEIRFTDFKAVYDFRNHISIQFSAPENRDSENIDKHRRTGIMMHDVFSAIRTANDIPSAIHQLVLGSLLDESDAKKWEAYLEKIVANPNLAFLFDGRKKIYNEKEILLKDKRILRPDRIVVDSEATWLVDYKTGIPDPRHRKQLDGYATGVLNAGYSNVNKCLIYLDPENLEKVDFEKWA